jgi:hypothetical protein
LLRQDEARFSMLPILRTTLGLKGHRPVVGNLHGHDLVYLFGALNLVTGRLSTRLVERLRASAKSTPGHRALLAGVAAAGHPPRTEGVLGHCHSATAIHGQ